jgi:valyl-tRNA synthetase
MLGFFYLKKFKTMKYLIDTPPPTISGKLHIGHIFSYTQADIIARYQKYLGKDLLYPWCFDNNGIPTGKLASNKGIKGQQNIIDFSIEKSKEYLDTFNKCGIEFSNHNYHTFDQKSIDIAYKCFELLKSKGIAYRSESEYLWCPSQKCSISQSEIGEDGRIERSGEYPEIKKGWGWFINIKDHIGDIEDKINQINWKPERFKQNALNWCKEIKWDWSISRERHFGIPIPGEENMTFDTWFISSLSPQIAYISMSGDAELNIPIFDLRFQSHDIIRTWAFYTICMSHFINDQIPWKTIMITGHTLDGQGNKFSKSSGNATSPIPLIDKWGSNGIRYWSSSNTLGTDTKIDEDKMKMGWRIQNKLINAEKFINMQISNGWIGEDDYLIQQYLESKSIIMNHIDNFEIDKASSDLYHFFWDIFCSNWIENSKKNSTSYTLKWIIDDLKNLMKIFFNNL